VLMLLNLLPIPPLDGGRILTSLLPVRAAWRFAKLEPWGVPLLLVLLFLPVYGSNALSLVLSPQGDIAFSDEGDVGTTNSWVWPFTAGLRVGL